MRRSQNNLLSQDAAGNAVPIFPGGVILPTGTLDLPDTSVQWQDVNGAQVAVLSSNANRLHMRSATPAGTKWAEVYLDSGFPDSAVFASAQEPGGFQYDARVIDSQGGSDFLRPIAQFNQFVDVNIGANAISQLYSTPPQITPESSSLLCQLTMLLNPGGQGTTGTVGYGIALGQIIGTLQWTYHAIDFPFFNIADTRPFLASSWGRFAVNPFSSYFITPYYQIFNQPFTVACRGNVSLATYSN